MRRNSAALFLFAVALGAQSDKKPGQVDGQVVNSVTQEPIRKAVVILQQEGQKSYNTTTDSAGHFHFDTVEPGTYFAVANRDGFTDTMRYTRRSGPKSFTVAEEQQVKDVAIKLLPLATVSGRVLDEDGDPIARAGVQALRRIYGQAGARQFVPGGFASSNDLGEYELLDIEPGKYYLQVTPPRRASNFPPRTRFATPEEAYPLTYYPNATEVKQAASTDVPAGAQLSGMDFRLRQVRAFHVRGKLVDGKTGEPARNAYVRLLPYEAARGVVYGGGGGRIGEDGTFDLPGVVSGSYIAMASLRGQGAQVAEQEIQVGDQDVDDVALILKGPMDIAGTVRVEGTPKESGGQIHVSLLPLRAGVGSANAVVGTDGAFVLHVFPGVYRINVSRHASTYVKSMRFGDQDVTSGRIDLTHSGSGALNIVLETDVGEFQGSVQNDSGEPVAGAAITVAPADELADRIDLFLQLSADQNGKFEDHDLAPGDYKVLAWPDVDPGLLQSEDFRKAFDSRALTVSIPPGGHASALLRVIPAADVEAAKNKLP